MFNRRRSWRLPSDIQRVALRKLLQIDAATRLETLDVPPDSRPEALAGDRRGQHANRINDQWRICFVWREGDAYDVAIVTITAPDAAPDDDRLAPVHSGEILLEDFLKPMGLSQYRLARALGVPPQRVHDLVHGRRAVTGGYGAAPRPGLFGWSRSSG